MSKLKGLSSRRSWFAAILIIVAAVVICFLYGAKEKAPLIASGHPEWPPIMSQSGDEIVGAGPELVEKIFAESGVEVDSKYAGAWDTVQAKARAGEVDVIVAAYKTDERETYLDFSDAYTQDPIAIFVNKENKFEYREWSDLAGKRGVATIGDSYGQELDDYISQSLDVVRVETAEQAFRMLEEKEADYFFFALYSGQAEIKRLGNADKVEALPTYAATEDFYIAISKKSPYAEYLPQVNALIAKYKADGTIGALIEKYKE
jgi:polar amino acid transport system substrate-binding protein